ncbi:hypothetical protein OG599_17745 [Streptomyces sp. NBC_01335]|uniref:hypothetical protein n=1 Tax=Streptomyces sp. NBC_01335 TaxID=2903828 RepID=UPI002E0DA176|nr:hypothetical protein OG599_17745 [Streptomyces sp. NBC_01335]
MSGKRSHKALKSGKHDTAGKHDTSRKHGRHERSGGFEEPGKAGKTAETPESGEPAASGPSKVRLLIKVGTGSLAVVRAVKRVRRTTGGADKLLAADSVAGLLPMITAVAIVVRQLRRKQSSAHATP